MIYIERYWLYEMRVSGTISTEIITEADSFRFIGLTTNKYRINTKNIYAKSLTKY